VAVERRENIETRKEKGPTQRALRKSAEVAEEKTPTLETTPEEGVLIRCAPFKMTGKVWVTHGRIVSPIGEMTEC
jgi:hypothetical protein